MGNNDTNNKVRVLEDRSTYILVASKNGTKNLGWIQSST